VKPIKVRAIYRATAVAGFSAPFDSLTLKIYYPCQYSDSFDERNTGMIPADPKRAPFPVVIIMPGINLSQEAYGWIAKRLAESGFVAVTYSWVTMELGDMINISPGVELKRLTHKRYGKKPSCPAIAAVLSELKRVQKKGVLAGLLDLDKIILGGHSAGGTMALLNANPEWFPAVRGAFSYAAHTAANVQLGWEEDSIMPISRDLPLLVMGGSRDGVIASSSHRYGDDEDSSPTERVERTFHEGIRGKRNDRHLLIVRGANHFSFAWPRDSSTGRPFLDRKQKGSGKQIRKYLASVIITFCDYACSGDAMSAAELQGLCNTDHPLAKLAEHK
jgi:predicted dienelactone hydrolase